MADQHSKRYNRFSNKRKTIHDEEEQTLTLSRCTVRSSSSSSNQFKAIQSYSYKRHSEWKTSRRLDSTSMHVYRKWTYSDCDSSDYKDGALGCTMLKEVDCYSDLYVALQQDGYEGVLKARTGDAQDGCAIFWNHERFNLLHEESIEFQSFGLRNNVAQFCVLKMNADSFNPEPKMSKSMAHRLSEEWGGIPVVLGGDFNSVPQSAAYQYISSAKLDILQHDRKRVSGQIQMPLCHAFSTKGPFRNGRQKPSICRWTDEELKIASGSEEVTCLQHSLKLHSAYHGVPGSVTTRDDIGEPLATSFHCNFMGTVDYIWHSDQLVPVRVLETLPINALEKLGGLPSKLRALLVRSIALDGYLSLPFRHKCHSAKNFGIVIF
uniref:Endonuclease/exonuclease/phosphatase domain-containing protein n=1 Tax=Chenopodium quinoa TaxID=63459 RepID=A0A803MIB1_CHEQI